MLNTLDDAVLPAANWVLELLDARESLEEVTGNEISMEVISSFQENVTKPFISNLKENVSSRFASSGQVVSALSIFDPKKLPGDPEKLSSYGDTSIATLLKHYGVERPAETIEGEETVREPVVSSDITNEWKTYRQYMAKQPEENMKLQLKQLTSNEMLKTMFPNLNTLASISLSIPVATASVERSFSQMKLIKTRLRSSLSDSSLSSLMKVAIETEDKLTDSN